MFKEIVKIVTWIVTYVVMVFVDASVFSTIERIIEEHDV